MGLIAVMAEPSANEIWSRRRIRRAAEKLHKKPTCWKNGILYFVGEGDRVPEAPSCPKPARHVRVQHLSPGFSVVPATARNDTPSERQPEPSPKVLSGNGKVPKPDAEKKPRPKLSLPEGRTPPLRTVPQRGAGGRFLSRRQI